VPVYIFGTGGKVRLDARSLTLEKGKESRKELRGLLIARESG
jgi:hypothetical protein